MTTSERTPSIFSTGLAMFAMFFGAGNIVFPLALGQLTLDKNFYAILGMIITAVIVPLAGLLAMMLFEGDYNTFFKRIGKWPGFSLILLILAIIGPMAGIPRCITITYSTLSSFGIEKLPGMNLISFSIISCLILFVFVYKPNKIISLLGYVLTPILLISLAIIVFKGFFGMPPPAATLLSKWETFSHGFIGGYNTLDLTAAFFFSSVVLVCLKKGTENIPLKENKPLFKVAIVSSLMAAVLLAIVYICFSYIAAGYSASLANVPGHQILGVLAYQLMGPYAGLVVGIAVTFACITTEIALTAIFAEFLKTTLFKDRISHPLALVMTLSLAFVVSTLNFEGISSFLGPLLKVFYPSLIVLTLINILHKLYNFKPVKSLFYGAFGISLIYYII